MPCYRVQARHEEREEHGVQVQGHARISGEVYITSGFRMCVVEGSSKGYTRMSRGILSMILFKLKPERAIIPSFS